MGGHSLSTLLLTWPPSDCGGSCFWLATWVNASGITFETVVASVSPLNMLGRRHRGGRGAHSGRRCCNWRKTSCYFTAILSFRLTTRLWRATFADLSWQRSEEHTSELQSLRHLVCR